MEQDKNNWNSSKCIGRSDTTNRSTNTSARESNIRGGTLLQMGSTDRESSSKHNYLTKNKEDKGDDAVYHPPALKNSLSKERKNTYNNATERGLTDGLVKVLP